MENLFLEALDENQAKAIEETKINKAFALRLVKDLDMLFNTNYMVEDLQNGVEITMRTSSSSTLYGCFKFVVNNNGIKFISKNLGYYKNSSFKNLGGLYEKYKHCGTTAEQNFLRDENTPHGFVYFNIPIRRDDVNLKETLKDIIYLMEQNQYKKRF
jgi:hypothetical protein